MEFLVPLLILVILAAVLIPRILRRNRTSEPTEVTHRGGLPKPGEPPATRDGHPLPGSQEDRARRGQP